jgi:1-acyl-sn-glycerol-3-phosphate acyltransferase
MSEETQIKSKSSILPPPDRRPDGFTPLYRPTRAFFRLYYALKGGLSVYGAENIPETGGVILATNHISLADPPVLAAALKRPLRYMAKIELFENKFFGNIITQLGAFPIERGAADRAAIRKALSIVANGELLVIFPEGSRGDGITLGPRRAYCSRISRRHEYFAASRRTKAAARSFDCSFWCSYRSGRVCRKGRAGCDWTCDYAANIPTQG